MGCVDNNVEKKRKIKKEAEGILGFKHLSIGPHNGHTPWLVNLAVVFFRGVWSMVAFFV